MNPFPSLSIGRWRWRAHMAAAAAVASAVALVAAHLYVHSLSPSGHTPLVLLDHLFNLGLAAVVLGACWSTGLRLLRLLGCGSVHALPGALTAIPLGLGVVGYGAFALGMAGFFQPIVLVVATGALVAICAPDIAKLLPLLEVAVREGQAKLRKLRGPDALLLILGCAGFPIALVIGLAPPTDYDGLMYHLAAPARFLDAGRIYPMLDLDGANYPFTAEMVYSVGLAFGGDAFGRLVNLALWGLLALGTWWIGRGYMGPRTGFLASLVFFTAPGAYLASSTSVEIMWAIFFLAGVLAFLQYLDQGGAKWIVVMGLFCGLTLGTKMLAVGLPLALGVGLGIDLLFVRRQGLLATFRLLALFAAVTVVVGAPWYVKNWLWFGSPLYPVFASVSSDYLSHGSDVGNPKTLAGFLTLPLSIFFPSGEWALSAGVPSYLFVSYLFLALPAVALAPRSRYTKYMMIFGAIFFVVWAAGYQLVRFLFPVYPVVSLLVAHGLAEGRIHRWGLPRPCATGLLALFLGASLALQSVLLVGVSPLRVVAGLESPADFLSDSKAVWTYPAVRWANEHLPTTSRLYLVGSGQIYYFRRDVVPDQSASNLGRLFLEDQTGSKGLGALRKEGFTHIFLSDGDVRWFMLYRDPQGSVRQQMHLLSNLLDHEATLLYHDRQVRIYQLAR